MFVKHRNPVISKIPTKLRELSWCLTLKKLLCYNKFVSNKKATANSISHTIWMNWSVLFHCDHLSLQSGREKKRTQNNENYVIPSHGHVSWNHLLFPLATSALAKFMWPLPWPLTSAEKHLFEGKDSWHNPTPNLLMWFTLNN